MRIVLLTTFVLGSAFGRLDPCGGGAANGNGNGGAGTPAVQNGGPANGAGNPNGTPAAQNGAPANGAVTIPDVFYDAWLYRTATLYQKGKDPIIDGISGTAQFNRDLSYVMDYFIGDVANHFEGKYVVNGPDPRITGAFFITTYDQDQKEVFKLSVACGDTTGMALTSYADDGTPDIVYGLVKKQ